MKLATIALPLLVFAAFAWQTPPRRVLPPQTPLPGAPTGECSFLRADPGTPIRITTGKEPIPYQFACGVNRPSGICAINTLLPGLIVMLGQEQNGWACVTGGDSTSGWVPVRNLSPVPATPQSLISEWLGWWRRGKDVKGVKNDRLLITSDPGSNVLHVSGRAYWYGLNDNVHLGSIQADATPVGVYLHAVEATGGCVLDLKLDQTTHTLKGYDNEQCGGMNVRFSGTWTHFKPVQSAHR